MNRQRSGFGLYAAFMVIIVLAMFYITGKISAGSSPSQQKFETAVKDGKVTSAQIVQNKEVPTGSVVVQEQGGDSYTVNVTDVNAAISLLEDADVTYTVQNVQRDSIFMTSVLPALLLGMILLFGMSMMNRSMGGGGGGGHDPDPDPDPRHDHPTPSSDPELPYTGQDWRTVGLLSAGGVILLSLGLFRRRKDHEPSQPE